MSTILYRVSVYEESRPMATPPLWCYRFSGQLSNTLEGLLSLLAVLLDQAQDSRLKTAIV